MGETGDYRNAGSLAQFLCGFDAFKQKHPSHCNGERQKRTIQGVISNGQLLVWADDSGSTRNFNDRCFGRNPRPLYDILGPRLEEVDIHLFVNRKLALHAKNIPLGSWNATESLFKCVDFGLHIARLACNSHTRVFDVALDRKTCIANCAVESPDLVAVLSDVQ